MPLQRGFERPADYCGGYVSIGNFDGVHRGHQSMVAVLVRRARDASVPAVVLTFDPHPIKVLRPQHAPPSLSTVERKAELLSKHGVDCVIAYPTDQRLLNLTPERFFAQIVQGELQARGLVEGPNFFFGRDRAGDIETLRSLCREAGLSLDVVPPVRFGDRLVSSSAIRAAVSAGRLRDAVELLGHPYRLQGRVVGGADRGRSLGFPTANLAEIVTLLPRDGVYAGVAILEGRRYPAAVNVGTNPTFGETQRKVEAHLVGFSGELYGTELGVDLLERLRDVVKFESAEALHGQLAEDVEAARRIAERWVSGEGAAPGERPV